MTTKKTLADKLYPFDLIFKPTVFADELYATGVKNRLDELEAIYNDSLAAGRAINQSGQYTRQGKQAKLKELLAGTQRQLQEFAATNVGYARTIEQIKDGMVLGKDKPNDVVGELRKQEIRLQMRQMDPVDQEVEYRTAVERNDYLFMDAIEQSPIRFNFATQALIDKVIFQRMERAHPKDAEKLKDVTQALDMMEGGVKSVRAALASAGLDLTVLDQSITQAA